MTTKQITISLNRKQNADLERTAKKLGISPYAFCKNAVLKEIGERVDHIDIEETTELQAIKKDIAELKKIIKNKL